MSASNERLLGNTYVFFLPYMVLFLTYIGIGYYYSLSTEFKTLPNYAIIAITAGFMAIVYFFVRHTGLAIHRYRSERGWSRVKHLILFLFLFFFSGYGFLAASLLLLEGPNICRENIETAIKALAQLQEASRALLPVKEFEDLKNRVEINKRNLGREIVNEGGGGNYCGIGESALAIFRKLQADLPELRLISGTYLPNPASPVQQGRRADKRQRGTTAFSLEHNCSFDPNRFKKMRADYESAIDDNLNLEGYVRSAARCCDFRDADVT
jgi:hypothetical protein